MTQPDASQPVPENEIVGSAVPDDPAAASGATVAEGDADSDTEAEPEPLPWTPERVTEWNAYYDVYVMLAALLLVFVVSANRVTHSALWTHLKAGQLIAQQASPLVSDEFSYTETGQRWVNIPWLFQLSHAVIYNFVVDLVPTDPNAPTANRSSAEHIAVGVLVGLNAMARLLTAFLLLKIRREGPGRWWSAICAVLALGALFGPFGAVLGGIAGPAIVAPATWGLLLLALEMLLLHRALNQGRRAALMGLIPLFILWANVDESFLMGLVVLAASVIGRALDGKLAESLIRQDGAAREEDSARELKPISTSSGFAVLGLCVLACLANPATYRIYLVALTPLFQLFQPAGELVTVDQLSYFGKGIRQQVGSDWYLLAVYYLITVAVGLGSFLVNARRFAWSRFLPFVAVAVSWGIWMRLGPEFAVVFAAVAALNGQEWYHDRFGTEGRLGTGWSVWSTGGRLVTLALMFGFVGIAITGWRKLPGEPRFGFDFDADEFAFEAAEYLAGRDEIKGNVLNTTQNQGDCLVWKAYPKRKTFLDSRTNLFPRELQEQLHHLRNALRDDDQAVWKPQLDKFGISAVLIEPTGAPNTYRRLMQSPNWIPFYDDGRTVVFGRADAPEPDLAVFKSNRLEPDLQAYRLTKALPSAERPPTPTTWLDEYFQNRTLSRPQAHSESARRWLQGPNPDPDRAVLPEPARCLLAIREARTALALNPDDWVSYRILNLAYRFLAAQETALLAGIPLTSENQARITSIVPNYDYLSTRLHQRLTALNYAIQTTPPPRSPEARVELLGLHREMYEVFLQTNSLDLARDQLQAMLDLSQPGDFPTEALAQYEQQLDQLNQRVKQIEDNLSDLQIERQAGPVEKAMYAVSQGATGLALAEFEEAERGNMSPAVVKPQLVDLYCKTGQPDKALELLTAGTVEDPNLGTEPGAAAMRQGQVYMLLGNYLSAGNIWQERAIPKLRFDRSLRALTGGQILSRGEVIATASNSMTLPGMVTQQAMWEFELGQCRLESGSPDQAAEHFTKALTIAPDLVTRPIIAYYLEKLGKPVPAPAKTDESATSLPTTGSAVDRLLKGGVPGEPSSPPANVTKPAKPDSPSKPEAPAATKDVAKPAPATPAGEAKKP